MKRVLTKKPQLEKTVLGERPKRNLKFSLAEAGRAPSPLMTVQDVEMPAMDAPVEIPMATVTQLHEPELVLETPPVSAEPSAPQVVQTTLDTDFAKPRPVAAPRAERSVADRILSVVMPVAAFAALGGLIVLIALNSGYDVQYLASRLN